MNRLEAIAQAAGLPARMLLGAPYDPATASILEDFYARIARDQRQSCLDAAYSAGRYLALLGGRNWRRAKREGRKMRDVARAQWDALT